MTTANSRGTDWTDLEVDLIVADYFEMLKFETTGVSYVKAQRNAELQKRTGRSKGSIEFKHQNISAILMELGLPWIRGYKPMNNYQHKLIERIEAFVPAQIDALSNPTTTKQLGLSEEALLFVEAPPPLAPDMVPLHPALTRLVRKFDPAARDALNRDLGRQGEERVLRSEQAKLSQAGLPDLANKVRWVSDRDGDGAGYDILSFDVRGKVRLLEVKTTVGHQTTPFFISDNERRLSNERPNEFRIVRLYDMINTPKAFELSPPLERFVFLNATQYRASFSS